MLDPFVDGRSGIGGVGGGAIGFAPEREASLPADIALAYASVLDKAPPQGDLRTALERLGCGLWRQQQDERRSGGRLKQLTAQHLGFAGGMDYHVTPDTVVGFALAGGGTNWGLAQGLGSWPQRCLPGWRLRHDAASARPISPARWRSPITGSPPTALRSAIGSRRTSSARALARGSKAAIAMPVLPAFGVTPYAAVQAQDFHTPAYSETDVTGGGFGLTYAAMNATDVRSELGARFDDPTLLYGKPLILLRPRRLGARFGHQPGAQRCVRIAAGRELHRQRRADPARTPRSPSAGAQLFLTPRWIAARQVRRRVRARLADLRRHRHAALYVVSKLAY